MSSLFSLVALSLDSFVASSLLGAGRLGWRQRLVLALSFGMCDGLAAMLGTLGPQLVAALAALELCSVGTFLLFCTALRKRWIYALPVLLSLDNLFAANPRSPAFALGLTSASMALIGFFVGTFTRHAFLTLTERWSRDAHC